MSNPIGNKFRSAKKPYERPRPRASDGMWKSNKAQGVPASVVNSTLPVANKPGLNNRLAVSNLHYSVTARDLITIFGQIGTLVREPVIKYDRSGRSTGVAYIAYETPVEATRAKNQFNGILAKGQPMTVTYDIARPARFQNQRSVSAPSSLADRISKPPLLDRLALDNKDAIKTTVSRPEASTGPIRTRNRRGGRPDRVRKQPKTADDLDKELDAFMNNESNSGPTGDVEMEL